MRVRGLSRDGILGNSWKRAFPRIFLTPTGVCCARAVRAGGGAAVQGRRACLPAVERSSSISLTKLRTQMNAPHAKPDQHNNRRAKTPQPATFHGCGSQELGNRRFPSLRASDIRQAGAACSRRGLKVTTITLSGNPRRAASTSHGGGCDI